MNSDLIKLYQQLDDMAETKETTQLKNQIQQTLYQNLRANFLDLMNIGEVIGYDKLSAEMKNAVEFLDQLKSVKKK